MMSRSDFAWYVLRVPYSREMTLKEHLDSLGMETFVPLHYREYCKHGIVTKKLEPVVHNLLFVYAMRAQLDEIKPRMEYCCPFRFFLDRTSHKPIVIPDRQMRHFMAVAGTSEEQHIYLESVETSLSKGDRVRVIAGPFAGIEGVFMRLKGDRRVVVSLSGIMTVATAFIHPSFVEKID